MKAKMLLKEAETGIYMCQQCECRFFFEDGSLSCPICGNRNPYGLVPIYKENDDLEEQLYNDDDFGQGD